jgi:hypothetical protein
VIVRALDANGDWLFGKGTNDYKAGTDAIKQTIGTRLNSFLGDCFFAGEQGLDWFNYLAGKDQVSPALAVASTIATTPSVTGLDSFSPSLDTTRTASYVAATTLGPVSGQFSITQVTDFLLTESSDFLTDEDGGRLEA